MLGFRSVHLSRIASDPYFGAARGEKLMGRSFLVVPLVAVSLIAAACGGSGTSGGGNELTGSIFVSGSSTVEPVTALVAEKFAQENPGVAVNVEGPGTGDGFQLLCNGETDMSDASRAIKPEGEADLCQRNGIEYIELKVGIDGLSVLTSHDNTGIDCLSFADLYALLGPESEGFRNWSDANALAQDLSGSLGGEFGEMHAPYPDEPLVVTAPGEESGTYDSFVEIALQKIADARGTEHQTRADYQSSANDNVIIDNVAGSPSSLGWVGFAYFEQNQDVVRALPVDGGDGCVTPDPEAISTASYPIARPLFIYVNKAKAAESPALEAFVDFYMTDAGLVDSVTEVGYVQVHQDDMEATRSIWESERP
jgi:phosphate transport system substrate-binding protein